MPSLSKEGFIKEQAADSTLKSLYELVGQESELKGVTGGYFLRDGLLLRRWSRVVDDMQVDSVVQVVVPSKFREGVLSTLHDGVAVPVVTSAADCILPVPLLTKILAANSQRLRCCAIGKLRHVYLSLGIKFWFCCLW